MKDVSTLSSGSKLADVAVATSAVTLSSSSTTGDAAGATPIGGGAGGGGGGAMGSGGVGLEAAVALSQAAGSGEVDDATKLMIRQTAEWFNANPDKSKVRIFLCGKYISIHTYKRISRARLQATEVLC